MKIHILNAHKISTHPRDILIFRVDRRTPLGNPFMMSSEHTRADVIEKYRRYFLGKIATGADTAFLNELQRIEAAARKADIALECWCAPKPCHAEIIAEYITRRITEYDRNGG